MRLSMEEVQKQHESTKKLYEQGLAVEPVDVKRVLDLYDTIEALQQENEQLRAQVAAMREALEEATETIENIYERDTPQTEKYRDILNVGTTDYHNPADVEALRKAREALDYWRELYGIGLEVLNWHMNGDVETFDSFYDSSGTYEALAEIDKVIGGKEDV